MAGCPSWVKRRQQLLQRTSPPKLLAEFLPNLAGMILIYPSLIIVQIVPIRCVSKSHRLKIDFQDENYKNLFLCNHKAQNLDIIWFEYCFSWNPKNSFLSRGPYIKGNLNPIVSNGKLILVFIYLSVKCWKMKLLRSIFIFSLSVSLYYVVEQLC